MSRYFQPRWAYLSRSVSTTSYFGAAGQVSLCGRRGHLPGSRPAASRAGDSRPGPGGGAAPAGGGAAGGAGVPGQMGGEASSELGASIPGAPVNLCPESVTSSCCGSLPGVKNSSFSFESFLVSGSSGSPHPRRPTEKQPGGPRGRAAGKAGSSVHLAPCTEEEHAPPPHSGVAGLRRLSKLLLNAQEVKLVVLGAELGRRLKKRERERQRGLSRKQLSLKTRGARCPRPDPAGRSAAPVLHLLPWRGRPRKLEDLGTAGGQTAGC